MVWSNWRGAISRGALLILLCWAGLAWTQGTPPSPATEGVERIMVVHENGKKTRCRVMESWKLPDGRMAHLLQVIETGAMMTIVDEQAPNADQSSLVATNPRAMPKRIFPWLGNRPPEGSPIPEHLRINSGVIIKNNPPPPADAGIEPGPHIVNRVLDEQALGKSFGVHSEGAQQLDFNPAATPGAKTIYPSIAGNNSGAPPLIAKSNTPPGPTIVNQQPLGGTPPSPAGGGPLIMNQAPTGPIETVPSGHRTGTPSGLIPVPIAVASTPGPLPIETTPAVNRTGTPSGLMPTPTPTPITVIRTPSPLPIETTPSANRTGTPSGLMPAPTPAPIAVTRTPGPLPIESTPSANRPIYQPGSIQSPNPIIASGRPGPERVLINDLPFPKPISVNNSPPIQPYCPPAPPTPLVQPYVPPAPLASTPNGSGQGTPSGNSVTLLMPPNPPLTANPAPQPVVSTPVAALPIFTGPTAPVPGSSVAMPASPVCPCTPTPSIAAGPPPAPVIDNLAPPTPLSGTSPPAANTQAPLGSFWNPIASKPCGAPCAPASGPAVVPLSVLAGQQPPPAAAGNPVPANGAAMTPANLASTDPSKTPDAPKKTWHFGDRITALFKPAPTTPAKPAPSATKPDDPKTLEAKNTKTMTDLLPKENELAMKKMEQNVEKMYNAPFSTAMATPPVQIKPEASPLSIPSQTPQPAPAPADNSGDVKKDPPYSLPPPPQVLPPAPKRDMWGTAPDNSVLPPGKSTLDPVVRPADKLPPATERKYDPLMMPEKFNPSDARLQPKLDPPETQKVAGILPPSIPPPAPRSMADAPRPLPDEGRYPPGSQSVLAAKSGLPGPVMYVPVPTVTVPQPHYPPAPPEPNLPEAPQLNTFVNAFTENHAPRTMPQGGAMMPAQATGYGPMMNQQAMMAQNPMYAQQMYQQQMMAQMYQQQMMQQQAMNTYMPPSGMMNPMMGQAPYGYGNGYGNGYPMPAQAPAPNYGRSYVGPQAPNPFAMNPAAQTGFMPTAYQQPAVAPQYYIATQVEQTIRALRESPYPAQREAAAHTLVSFDWRTNPQLVPVLLQSAQQDPAPTVRAGCVYCLGRMQAAVEPVLSTLQRMRNDTDPRVRQEVEQALVRLGQLSYQARVN